MWAAAGRGIILVMAPATDSSPSFTLGVEEEFLIFDAESHALRPRAEDILPQAEEEVSGEVEPEFHLSQLETATSVCHALGEVREELMRLRRELTNAADKAGARIGAAGTHPFSDWREGDEVTPKEAYQRLERDFQQLAREKIICGCHVHVSIDDPEEVVHVMNRVRPWLSPVLALAVNSPFWTGVDTGYGSYRTEIWRRWPTAGTARPFGSRSQYEELVDAMVKTGTIDDPGRIHWCVRPSPRFDTVEFRVTDVCLTVDEAVMVAGLFRALAQTGYAQFQADEPLPDVESELIRAATWRASRYGIEGELIDVVGKRSVPALEMIDMLLDFVRPALSDSGDWEEVSQLVKETTERGTGASRQREAFARRGRIEDVADLIVAETTS